MRRRFPLLGSLATTLMATLWRSGLCQKTASFKLEIFLKTRNTGGARLVFHTELNCSPAWDPEGNLTVEPKFTDPVDLVIEGDYQGTLKGWDSSDDAPPEYPRLGRAELYGEQLSYTISVEGGNAKLYVDCYGYWFTGDKYVVYDRADDKFYWDGTSTEVTHIDLYNDPTWLQPTAPLNFRCTNSGSVGQHPHFSWDAPVHPSGVTFTYDVYRDVGDGYHKVNAAPIAETEFTDTGVRILKFGNPSYYYVTARAAHSPESDPSNTVVINTDTAAKPGSRAGGRQAQPGQPSAKGATELLPPAPNPFNSTTVLSYRIVNGAFVKLQVMDLTGRVVAHLANGYRDAGMYQVAFRAGEMPSGVYLVILQAGRFRQCRKILLLK